MTGTIEYVRIRDQPVDMNTMPATPAWVMGGGGDQRVMLELATRGWLVRSDSTLKDVANGAKLERVAVEQRMRGRGEGG